MHQDFHYSMNFVGKLLKVQHYWIMTRNIQYSMKFTRNHQPASIYHASYFMISTRKALQGSLDPVERLSIFHVCEKDFKKYF